MPKSPPSPINPLDAFDAETYLDLLAPVIVGVPDDAYREGVVANLQTAKLMAEKVFAVSLTADTCDLAGVFTPIAVADGQALPKSKSDE